MKNEDLGGGDESRIRGAIAKADPNVLRMALYQLTGDAALLNMRVEKFPVRGGAQFIDVLAAEHHRQVQELAVNYLTGRSAGSPATISSTDLRMQMESFTGGGLADEEVAFGTEELALADFPRDVTWTDGAPPANLDQYNVIVIGAGICGIAASIMLERLGIAYTVYERQNGVGGTWLLNDYPEARVDVSGFQYQYKFVKNYPWPEYFPSQEETRKYLSHVVDKFGVKHRFHFNTEVTSAWWDDSTSEWVVEVTSQGREPQMVRANVVISASGLFSTPMLPDIEGVDSFDGPIFHTARWDHTVDYRGARIGLIGNGSSGAQAMPHLAEAAEHLTVFQRTPSWIMPTPDYRSPVSEEVRWLFDNVPYYWNWFCFSRYIGMSRMEGGQTFDPQWQETGGLISERNDSLRKAGTDYIHEKVGHDPVLLAKCLPGYAPFARRLVVDNGWYDALLRDNVDLVTERIEEITPTGIRTADGDKRELDILVLATGWQMSRYFAPINYVGRHGATLEDQWQKDGPRSYLGMTMPGFPNLFALYGPNGQPRSIGVYSWAEVWTRYALQGVVALIESGSQSIECRRDVYDAYNEAIDEETKKLIWESEGTGGYYVNEFGRSSVNLPWPTAAYHAMVANIRLDDYVLE